MIWHTISDSSIQQDNQAWLNIMRTANISNGVLKYYMNVQRMG